MKLRHSFLDLAAHRHPPDQPSSTTPSLRADQSSEARSMQLEELKQPNAALKQSLVGASSLSQLERLGLTGWRVAADTKSLDGSRTFAPPANVAHSRREARSTTNETSAAEATSLLQSAWLLRLSEDGGIWESSAGRRLAGFAATCTTSRTTTSSTARQAPISTQLPGQLQFDSGRTSVLNGATFFGTLNPLWTSMVVPMASQRFSTGVPTAICTSSTTTGQALLRECPDRDVPSTHCWSEQTSRHFRETTIQCGSSFDSKACWACRRLNCPQHEPRVTPSASTERRWRQQQWAGLARRVLSPFQRQVEICQPIILDCLASVSCCNFRSAKVTDVRGNHLRPPSRPCTVLVGVQQDHAANTSTRSNGYPASHTFCHPVN